MYHQDCLVGGRKGDPDFHRHSQEYINEILPCEVASLPGLSFENISRKKLTAGLHSGSTVSSFLQQFKFNKFSAAIIGCNSPHQFYKKPEELIECYKNMFRNLYNNTACSVIFLATVFPQRIDMCTQNQRLLEGKTSLTTFFANTLEIPV